MSGFENRYWSSDGLKLHYRDYPGDPAGTPVICLPGLTRNARDFHDLACRLAGPRRVLAVNLRGRGGSDPARDAMSYVPACYVRDVLALLTDQQIGRFVGIGTSLGGIVTLLLGASEARLAGAVFNDVGPEVEAAGLGRVRGLVGKGSSFPTWMHAARALQETNGGIHPGWPLDKWLAMAKRLYRLTSGGRIVLDYDLRIAEPFRSPPGDTGPDLWRAWATLRDIPVLVVRGGRSDVLGARVARRMVGELAHGELLTVPGVGHAPLLDEPGVPEAIERLLAVTG